MKAECCVKLTPDHVKLFKVKSDEPSTVSYVTLALKTDDSRLCLILIPRSTHCLQKNGIPTQEIEKNLQLNFLSEDLLATVQRFIYGYCRLYFTEIGYSKASLTGLMFQKRVFFQEFEIPNKYQISIIVGPAICSAPSMVTAQSCLSQILKVKGA